MKVLFIGPYRQLDGWGEAAKATIRSLKTIKEIDLTTRPIYLCNLIAPYNREDNEFAEFEDKTRDSYDIIIQKCLPEYFVWHAKSKNIGFIATETSNLQHTPWPLHMNMMDEIWVPSKVEKQNLKSLTSRPINAVEEGIDTNIFKNTTTKKNLNFTFYTIGNGFRKNLNSLLLAFHSEFDRDEPVDLLIKTGLSAQQLTENIHAFKNTMGIYNNLSQYKQEILSTDFMSEGQLAELHQKCHCFVMPSFGEAWCRPAMEALGFGNTPIVTDNTGMASFINNKNGWLVPSYTTPVVCPEKPLPYLYTSRETWQQIDIMALRKAMRDAYENFNLRENKSKQGRQDVEQYSYENIGKKLWSILCN